MRTLNPIKTGSVLLAAILVLLAVLPVLNLGAAVVA
jgi:hypothetical protein